MLSLEYRPRTFAEMAGQDIVKKSLLHISKDPTNAPKTILLCGAFGTGKTTAARIFARALNCQHKLPNGDACGECEFCKSDIQDSMFYSEYDSAIVGNVKDIKELRNTFYFGYTKGYKVIVLDEVHLISKQAQGALLKVIEEPEPNVFYILCTTDPDKLLNTITSRSYALQYETVPPSDMIPFLEKVLTSKGITMDDTIKENLNLIAKRSNGHMRNAMMLLDSMLLLKEDFRDTVIDSTPTFIKFLTLSLSYKETAIQLIQKDLNGATDDASKQASISKVNTIYNQKVLSVIDELNKFNLNQLYQDYQNLVRRLAINIYGMAEDADLVNVVSKFKNSSELIEVLNDDLILSGFRSSVTFNTSMVILYNKLKTLKG